MARGIRRLDRPRSPDPGERASAEAAWANTPDTLNVAETADHQALQDQGLRLNRAFIQIKDPLVREALVTLAVDAARTQNGDAIFRASGRGPKTRAR